MCKTENDLREYNQQQIAEMKGPVNKYFTGLEVGHDPTDEEVARHYIEHGGPVNFRQRWEQQREHAN